jgi:rubrerythrin
MNESEISKLFETAIGREVEAHQFYRDVAERVQDPKVKEIFAQLAQEEKAHEELLWKLRHDPSVPMKFAAPADYKVAEAVELPEITLSMKPADALALAMKKEQQAMEFYQQLADWCTDDSVKQHYANLANMELSHKHRLEGLFVDVGYPEAW